MMTNEDNDADPRTLSRLISSLAWTLSRAAALSAGDVAALRRMDPRRPGPAFFKLQGLLLAESMPGDEGRLIELETRWAAIIVGLAQLGRLHAPERRLGAALASAGYSEVRFARLARADGDRLIDELPAIGRFLAAREAPADWAGAADLILSAGRSDEERVRRRLARNYYDALVRETVSHR